MTPEQFCYWLQGKAELDPTPPTPEQWDSIREHLALVLVKVTRPVFPTAPGLMKPNMLEPPFTITC